MADLFVVNWALVSAGILVLGAGILALATSEKGVVIAKRLIGKA